MSTTAASHREKLESLYRYEAALAALEKHLAECNQTIVVYDGTHEITRASRRVQIEFSPDVEIGNLERVLAPFHACIKDTERRQGRVSAWVYVKRKYSSFDKLVQWFCLVIGVSAFLAGFSIVFYAERARTTVASKPFY